MAIIENIDQEMLINMAGDAFAPTAYWELVTPDEDAAVQDELIDTDGVQLHTPIALGAARGENSNLAATKRNY